MKTTTNERRISIKKLPILTIPTIIAYFVVLLYNVVAFDKAEFKKYFMLTSMILIILLLEKIK